MAATAAEFADFLEPKLSNIWHDAFPAYESKFPRLFNVRDMEKNTITDKEVAGFGSLQTQLDGAEVIFDDAIDGGTRTYTYAVKALAYKVHERLWRNDLYGEVEKFERDLMDSSNDDAETAAAGILNNAFGTTNVGFDALQLCTTAHTRLDGGSNQANRAATDEAMSVTAIHNAYIQSLKWLNHRGRPRQFKPRMLVVPPDLSVTAFEILDSQLHPETANNTKNVIVNRFGLEEPLIWNYLTSTTAWFFVCTQHDLNFLWRFRPETGMETEWKTESINRKVRQGYVTGFGKWEGIFGSDGVA
jgi:hypothetical protein